MDSSATPVLDRLLAEGVIRPDHHAQARTRLQDLEGEPPGGLGGVLLWLMHERILSVQDLEEMEELAVSQGMFAGNATRRQALQEMRAAMQQEIAQLRQQARPRLPWLALGGAAALAAAVAWYVLVPAAPPRCDDAGIQQALRMGMFRARMKKLLSAEPPASDMFTATFSDVEELGYLKAQRSRGCVATVKIGEQSSTMAYTIAPDGQGRMAVESGHPRVLRARYSQVDADGRPIEAGQPAGARRLAAAFEQGVASFEKMRPAQPMDKRQRREDAADAPPAEGIARGAVRNIQPLGACRPLGEGRWSCRLQAEYRDRLLAALGRSEWAVLEGSFDFVQEGQDWRVGDDFIRQYMDATVRARVGEMKGEEAAARLEEIQSRRATAGPAEAAAGPQR